MSIRTGLSTGFPFITQIDVDDVFGSFDNTLPASTDWFSGLREWLYADDRLAPLGDNQRMTFRCDFLQKLQTSL